MITMTDNSQEPKNVDLLHFSSTDEERKYLCCIICVSLKVLDVKKFGNHWPRGLAWFHVYFEIFVIQRLLRHSTLFPMTEAAQSFTSTILPEIFTV